jgi:phosphate transport system substrate-binding protein
MDFNFGGSEMEVRALRRRALGLRLTIALAAVLAAVASSPAVQAQQGGVPRTAAQASPRVATNTATPADTKPVSPLVTSALRQERDLVAGLPPYLPKAPVAGKLSIAGSSAMNQLALLWADGLRHVHPEAKLDIAMFESGQVLPRLAKGEMQIGLMSRPLTEKEIKENGVIALASAKDVLGVVVNPANPLQCISQEQGIAILRDPNSKDHPGARTWGDLGVTGKLATAPINLYGRSSGTGAWGYLVQRFLGDDAATRTGKDCNSYVQICDAVAKDPAGVGYLSLKLAPTKVGKVLPLKLNTGEIIQPPKADEEVDPRYPLVRELYVVMKYKPGERLSPIAEEFLRYVLSRSGQEDAIKAGLLPLRRDEVAASRDQVGWTGKR